MGEGLTEALAAGDSCTHGGQIVISKTCFELVKSFTAVKAKQMENSNNYEIYEMQGSPIPFRAEAMMMRSEFDQEKVEKIQKNLRMFVPSAILPYLELNMQNYGNETRRLSIMFCNLEIDTLNEVNINIIINIYIYIYRRGHQKDCTRSTG